jgi:nucleotide-binding universal stress UspA family protein
MQTTTVHIARQSASAARAAHRAAAKASAAEAADWARRAARIEYTVTDRNPARSLLVRDCDSAAAWADAAADRAQELGANCAEESRLAGELAARARTYCLRAEVAR